MKRKPTNLTINRLVILICIIIFIVYSILNVRTNDNISTMILLGADYKTFTLGLGEYFRLITAGFGHFSLLHLICNMISLLSLGSFIETVYGKKRYLIYLLGGILIGSLTSGVLNTNIIESGISAALYGFLIIVTLYFIMYQGAITGNFISIVFLNICLNFLPNVAWQAHLGGAIAGFIFFFIDYYERTKNKAFNILFKALLVITIVFLSFKYYSTKDKIKDYSGTDMAYIQYTKDYVPFLYEHYEDKIYNYYREKGK